MEQVGMRIKVLRGEKLGALKSCFTRKVQLEENTKENEVQLHFTRGVLEGLQLIENYLDDLQKAERIEELKKGVKNRKQEEPSVT